MHKKEVIIMEYIILRDGTIVTKTKENIEEVAQQNKEQKQTF